MRREEEKRKEERRKEERRKGRVTVRVQSIDQLHQQAMLLQPMLRTRVQWWASRSHGWFKAKHPSFDGPFVKWDDEEEALGHKVTWAATKTFRRSMAKAERVYQYEVARVCDVTRETIWFDSLMHLYTCLMNISWDRWAEIVQVKNALDPTYGSHATGGFRFLKLLLRLRTPQAKELGLDGHVCEVLLVLKQLEEAKLPGSHARYIDWRDHNSAHIRRRAAPSPSFSLSLPLSLRPSPPSTLVPSLASLPRPSGAQTQTQTPTGAQTQTQRKRSPRERLPRRAVVTEELARVASQEHAARELDWRRGQRSSASARGVERAAMLHEYAQAIKDYLWGANNGVYGTMGKRRTTIEAATHSSAFAGCFRMKQPIASILCRPLAQALVGAVGLCLLCLALSELLSPSLPPSSSSPSPSSSPTAGEFSTRLGAEPDQESAQSDLDHQPWVSQPLVSQPLGFAPPRPLGSALLGLTMVSAALLGSLKMASSAVQVVKRLLVFQAGVHLLTMLCLFADQRPREALLVASWLASVLVWLLLVHYAPHTLLEAFAVSGTITVLATLAVRASVYGLSSGWAVLLDPVAGMGIVIGVVCKALVLWNEYISEQAFQRDVHVYEAIWKEILHQDRTKGVLDKLKFCTDVIEAGVAGKGVVLRQRSLEWHPSMDHEPEALDPMWWREVALWESPQLLSRAPATQSIDQLYAQAEVASVVMRHKLKHWAVGSKGLFLRKKAVAGQQRRQWARAAELLSGEEEDIRWGPLKHESRAIEKAFRCYGGDVSRLLDLSRHSIVFEEPEQMLQCLELLRADADVHVLRIKNELHPSQQGSCGYRQVLLNVAIVTEETQRMGVSMHVSEIQLLPLALALAKTDDGHRRYVMRRNARGE